MENGNPYIYQKTVDNLYFVILGGKECTITKNGEIIENVKQEGLKAGVSYKVVGAEGSAMFKTKKF